MFSGDAQDIIGESQRMTIGKKQQSFPNLNLTNVDKKILRRPEVMKCPPGMHRELFNLYVHQGKDNNKEKIESLIPTNTKRGYTVAKAQLGKRVTHKWHWQMFENEARSDGLQLPHWEREDKLGQQYQFVRFNKQLEPVTFTDEEYTDLLLDPQWTKEETLHLLELCHQFDLRWPIIQDRFNRERFSVVKKSMEDMKERYYNLVNELNLARDTEVNMLAYDAEHERRRKEQLEKLLNRTEEQIKEEEELKEAVKRIETKRKDRERKAHDLQRLINATERVSVSPDSSISGTPSLSTSGRIHRRSLKKMGSGQSSLAGPIMPTEPHIRWPEYKQPGSHLRSQEMKLPSNTAQRKLTNIGVVVTKLEIVQIGMEYPHASEDIVHMYNDFRSNIVLLQELKTAVHNTEQEIDQLQIRLKAEKDIVVHVEPRLRVSDLFYDVFEQNPLALTAANEWTEPSGSNSNAKGKEKDKHQEAKTPITNRQITKLIEMNPITITQTRKRRANPHGGSEGTTPPVRTSSQRIFQ